MEEKVKKLEEEINNLNNRVLKLEKINGALYFGKYVIYPPGALPGFASKSINSLSTIKLKK